MLAELGTDPEHRVARFRQALEVEQVVRTRPTVGMLPVDAQRVAKAHGRRVARQRRDQGLVRAVIALP